MKYSIVYKVLARTICAEFYRLNSGFFFITIAFAFGLLRPIEHIALATYFVHSYFLLALLFGVWTLYTIKTVQFTVRAFAQEENLFLNNLYLLPDLVKFMTLLMVQFILYEPILLYAAFMAYYALAFHQYYALLLLLLFNILSIGAPALYYMCRLKYAQAESKQSRFSLYINQTYTKPYFVFFLYHVFQKQLSLFVVTKLFSLLLIASTVYLYAIEDYSQTLLSLGTLVAFSANAVLAFHFNRFEQLDIWLFKNLPIPLSRRFLNNVLTYSFLLLPEIFLLLRHLSGDLHLWVALKSVVFGLSLPLMLHSYVLYRQVELDIFIRHTFFIVIFYFVCILFRTDLLLAALLNIVFSYYIYRKYFYRAEVIILPNASDK